MILKRMYCVGTTQALAYASLYLSEAGVPLSDSPGWDIGHLLLDVPSFRPGSPLLEKKNLDTLLYSLPRDVTIWGGNLDHPALSMYHTVDLLKIEDYLMENAEITAHCALKLALPLLHTAPEESPVLIIGWGRIGKHLAALLKEKGYPVVAASRDPKKNEKISALGCEAADTANLRTSLPRFQLIFNTAPASVLTEKDISFCKNCIKMDLASIKGIAGDDVIWARGLPGIHAPEQSGKLIAKTILALLKGEKK